MEAPAGEISNLFPFVTTLGCIVGNAVLHRGSTQQVPSPEMRSVARAPSESKRHGAYPDQSLIDISVSRGARKALESAPFLRGTRFALCATRGQISSSRSSHPIYLGSWPRAPSHPMHLHTTYIPSTHALRAACHTFPATHHPPHPHHTHLDGARWTPKLPPWYVPGALVASDGPCAPRERNGPPDFFVPPWWHDRAHRSMAAWPFCRSGDIQVYVLSA